MTGRTHSIVEETAPASAPCPARNPVVAAHFWRRRPGVTALIAGVLMLAVLSPRPMHGTDDARYHNQTAQVVAVIAGNLVEVNLPDHDHPTTRVRLWGVRTVDEAAANAYLRDHLLGREVNLLLAPDRSRDDAGQLLAYVAAEIGEPTINELLLESRLARVDTTMAHPMAAAFAAIERKARRNAPSQ